ncbi:MAG: DegT/DnrJ/EryC1/StrS family aminotransferase [Actinomycetota bacterium]
MTSERVPVPWVDDKEIDWDGVQQRLARSAAANHWSNFGPVSLELEAAIGERLDLPDTHRVVVTSSGTAALDAIAALEEHRNGRPHRWVVSDFGFHCTVQGPFRDAIVVDCDEAGILDLEAMAALDRDSYDAVLLTNTFGVRSDVSDFAAFTRAQDKTLLLDSAGSFGALRGGPGDETAYQAFSFHHTKPWGFGEGGAMVVPADDVQMARSVINFGLVLGEPVAGVATNGKMSDIAASFVLGWLDTYDRIRPQLDEQYERLSAIGRELGYTVLGDVLPERGTVPSCVPLLAPEPVSGDRFDRLPFVARKYYRPLVGRPVSQAIFERIVNVPCHRGVQIVSDEELRSSLGAVLPC